VSFLLKPCPLDAASLLRIVPSMPAASTPLRPLEEVQCPTLNDRGPQIGVPPLLCSGLPVPHFGLSPCTIRSLQINPAKYKSIGVGVRACSTRSRASGVLPPRAGLPTSLGTASRLGVWGSTSTSRAPEMSPHLAGTPLSLYTFTLTLTLSLSLSLSLALTVNSEVTSTAV